MSKFREGGPAFPFEYCNQTRSNQPQFFGTSVLAPGAAQQFAGMSLRDYFAAHAPAIPEEFKRIETITSTVTDNGDGTKRIISVKVLEPIEAYTARWNWAYADAMLK
jgi:hypothetical protein